MGLESGNTTSGCRRSKTVDFRYAQHSVMLPAFEEKCGVNQFTGSSKKFSLPCHQKFSVHHNNKVALQVP